MTTFKLQGCAALMVSFSNLGVSRKLDDSEFEVNADKDEVKATKILFRSDKYKAIRSLEGEIKTWIRMRSLASPFGKGTYLMPVSLAEEIETYLAGMSAKRDELVEQFIEIYPQLTEAAQTTLKGLWNAEDYPSIRQVRKSFGMEWRYIPLDVPDNLPEEIREREQAKAEALWAETSGQIRDGLREAFAKLVEHLAVSLTPAPDGKKRRFYDSSVENLVEFIRLFQQRNVMNDGEMAALTARAQDIITQTNTDELRSSATERHRIVEAMKNVQEAVTNLIVTEKRRKFDFD